MIVSYDEKVHRRFVGSVYCRGKGRTLEQFLALFDQGARCYVYVGTDSPDVFLGFLLLDGEGKRLYSYVKLALRAEGARIEGALGRHAAGAALVTERTGR